jgi:hypothetical protein
MRIPFQFYYDDQVKADEMGSVKHTWYGREMHAKVW